MHINEYLYHIYVTISLKLYEGVTLYLSDCQRDRVDLYVNHEKTEIIVGRQIYENGITGRLSELIVSELNIPIKMEQWTILRDLTGTSNMPSSILQLAK